MSPVGETAVILSAALIVDGAVAADPVISPDGLWVAWTTSSAGGSGPEVSELWLAPVAPTAAPIKLTNDRVRLPRWSLDSAWLFYIADAELRRLRITADGPGGDHETVLRWDGEVSGLVPLAGGRLVALVAGDEQTDDDKTRQAEHDDVVAWSERAVRQHWLWHRLRLLDLASGELSVSAGLAGRHVTAVAQRPDGGPLAVVSWDCPEYEPGVFTSRLHIANTDDGTAADLGPLGLEARSPVWWPGAGGWHVSWLEMVPPGEGTAVMDITVSADGTVSAGPENLTVGMAICPDQLVQVAGGPPGALFAEGLDTALYRLEPAGPSFRRVTSWAGEATALSASDDAAVIAVLVSTAYAPRDVSAGPPDALVRISDTRPELRSIALGTQERLSWRASDGLELDGVLVLPPGQGRADGPFPLVTMVHGGPTSRWADELMLSWVCWGQWLAAAGFAVFHPNPRGGTGHGHAFSAMVAGDVGQDEWTDILTGLDALVADGVADPAQLGIAGWSHGGYMAAWAVTQSSRFRAAVMGAGITDWAMQIGVGELGRTDVGLSGSFGWEGPGPHRHDQLSPISYAAKVTTPVLILHGEDDTNIPVGHATYFHRALTQFGTEHELVIYPHENHGFTKRSHQIDVLERVRSWFTRWLVPSGDR
ncbi:MAG: prolyl oligopeptidase family serine peptidase [Actinomycetota bacterium]|nr:prolyl oligopeptidase family serine peptidase [Actinomycetota bacterium]